MILTLVHDCINVIFTFIDSGQMFKSLMFTCKTFHDILGVKYYDYVDRFCDVPMSVALIGKGPLQEKCFLSRNYAALRKIMDDELSINFSALSRNTELPLDIIESYQPSRWFWTQIAKNVNITPDFVRKYKRYLNHHGYLAKHEWMTLEFMKEIGYMSCLWPISRHVTLEMFERDWYDEDLHLGLPPNIVLDVIRDLHCSASEPWENMVLFEHSSKFPLHLLSKVPPDVVEWESVHDNPNFTWDIVINNKHIHWSNKSLMSSVHIHMSVDTFDKIVEISGMSRSRMLREYSRNHVFNLDIARKYRAPLLWPDISLRQPIANILANLDLPWSWDDVSHQRLRYSEIKDHLHLPWNWRVLSRTIIITSAEYFSTTAPLDHRELLSNPNITWPIYKRLVIDKNMANINEDCLDIIFSFIDSGQMFKSLMFTCKIFYHVLNKRYNDYIDVFCDVPATITMFSGDIHERAYRSSNVDFLRKLSDINGVNIGKLMENKHLPLDIFEKHVDSVSHFAANVHLTPDVVRLHKKAFANKSRLAKFEWMTLEFMEEIGYKCSLWPLSQYVSLDYFIEHWYAGNEYRYLHHPPDIVLNVLRDLEDDAELDWTYNIIFECSRAYPMHIASMIPDRATWTEFVFNPNFTWDFLIHHINRTWRWYEVMRQATILMPLSVFELIISRPGVSLNEILSYYSRSAVPNIDIVRKYRLNMTYISRNMPLSDIINNLDVPWDWTSVSSRALRYPDIKDHLHLPWHWPTLSRSLIVSSTDFAKVADRIVPSQFLVNPHITWPVYLALEKLDAM